MDTNNEIKYYSPAEERINIGSHIFGFVLSIVASVLLVRHASISGNAWHIVSFSIFGVSLMVLFAGSSIYHSAQKPSFRRKMRVVDHAAIYVLIAGTYTPFTLVTLNGTIGWTLFGITWGMAVIGIVLKLFFTGRFSMVSTLMYVCMGWIIVFAIKPLINNLPSEGLYWLVAGGIAYTTGAILYGIKKIRFNHAIFHVFVLVGAACHFIVVYFYILPVGE